MLEILYQDEQLVAINKPSGLLVHRSNIDRHETRFALQLLRDQIGQRVYPLHRLDKPTSGVLLFALDSSTARELGEQMTAGQVKKKYIAVVRGHTDDSGVIDHELREELDAIADVQSDNDKPAQSAITQYETLARTELPIAVGRYSTARYSLVELRPLTGRKHQLRRHMKHIFHHMIGDTTHGDGKHNQMFRQRFDCHRLLLSALSLEFEHPNGSGRLIINAGLDSSFTRVLQETDLQFPQTTFF